MMERLDDILLREITILEIQLIRTSKSFGRIRKILLRNRGGGVSVSAMKVNDCDDPLLNEPAPKEPFLDGESA